MTRFFSSLVYVDSQWNAEDLTGILRLPNDYDCHFFRVVITVADVENRMTTAVVPLVPVPVQVLTGNLFKNHPQVMCFRIFKFKIIQVEVQGSVESTVTHIIFKHIQNTASF